MWVSSMFLIVLFQNLLPVKTALFLVPLLLITASILAIWSGIHTIRQMAGDPDPEK